MPIVIVPTGTGEVVTPKIVVSYNAADEPTLGYIYVSMGDRWDAIAYKMYGDATLVDPLMQWNPGIPLDDYVDQGTKVFVPLIVLNAPQTTSTPWG